MVPVPVRPPHARTAIDNRVSMMLPVLPVDVADPLERLKVIHERMVELKSSKEAEANYAINTATTYEPFTLVSLAFWAAARFPQRNVITVTTNVPGPPSQLYFMGRPVVELLPYVPISGPDAPRGVGDDVPGSGHVRGDGGLRQRARGRRLRP